MSAVSLTAKTNRLGISRGSLTVTSASLLPGAVAQPAMPRATTATAAERRRERERLASFIGDGSFWGHDFGRGIRFRGPVAPRPKGSTPRRAATDAAGQDIARKIRAIPLFRA